MDIKELILENNFLLILLNEEQYMNQICDIVRSAERTKTKICYVCISKKQTDVVCEFEKNGIDAKQFIFIDTLSSYYGLPAPENNCVYLYTPQDLELIKHTIDDIIKKEKNIILVIDTISSLLSYRENFTILKFTESLTTEENKKRIKKLFIALKNGVILKKENNELIKDLGMFADRIIEPQSTNYKSAKNQ